ncbi:MAG: hypothetical protein DRO67_09820 [Candidatus Asgardarchaeum californiense]|nr:MAG: hypothetical protein DRO67_09820 [Candidatus Asgardarchaeum californiense]
MKFQKTPHLAVDAVIRHGENIILVDRKFPPLGLALPGGFVNYGESCEDAVLREVKEETNLDCKIMRLIGVYSLPDRDERGHVVTIAYALTTSDTDNMKGQDDEVKRVIEISTLGIAYYKIIADHQQIISNSMGLL